MIHSWSVFIFFLFFPPSSVPSNYSRKNYTGSGEDVRAKELLWKQCAVDADGAGPGAVGLRLCGNYIYS